MSTAFAVYTLPTRKAAPGNTLRHAFCGLQLRALADVTHKERLTGQTMLLTRLETAIAPLPGSSRALELRYIVQPGTAANRWHEQVSCFILARLSAWDGDAALLRDQGRQFGGELQQLLSNTLPAYRFAPLTQVKQLTTALQPFVVADTGEIRQRVPDMAGEVALPLPLLGIPDADMIIEMLLRQPAPTLLTFTLEPTTLTPLSPLTLLAPAPPAGPDSGVGAIRRHEMGSELPTMDVLTRAYEAATNQRWQAQHLSALHQRAFRLRVQLAGAAPLSDALIATLVGEVGGPGRLTAETTWQEPSLPLAGGAVWARPRSIVPRGQQRHEASLALDNLRMLGFAPWDLPADLCGLADLGEATRLFALPLTAPWLPMQSAALRLPFPARVAEGLRLGVNRVRDDERPVQLPLASRNLHLWIVGQTGTGKSTLLESLILQDIYAGRGVIAIDPHGDLIAQILGKIPTSRKKDVIIFDPADSERIVGINPLLAENEAQQALVVSAFLALLRKLYDPFNQGITGPRFEHAARNGLLTVMSMPGGGTLIDFMRAFTDDHFRNKILPHVTDPLVKRYWTDQIAHTADFHRSEVLDWVVSKFGRFVTDPTIRRIVGQSKSSFSFREAMDSGKIVLLSLAKGLVGSDNANFLGLVLLPMILHAALSRVDVPLTERRDVALYIDEFQNYATDSLALMLAEARKYRVALTLANQHIGQLTPEIRDAVIGNVGSMLAFRLGVADAALMEHILAPSDLCGQHLVSLPNYTAYGRLMMDRQRTQVFTVETELVPHRFDAQRATALRAFSHERYARPRAEVDEEIQGRSQL
jgi:hypothetical protein